MLSSPETTFESKKTAGTVAEVDLEDYIRAGKFLLLQGGFKVSPGLLNSMEASTVVALGILKGEPCKLPLKGLGAHMPDWTETLNIQVLLY